MTKKNILVVGKLLVSGLLFFLLYRKTPLAQVQTVFAQCNLQLVWVIFLLLLVNTTLSALKWRILLLSDALDIPLRKLVVSYLIGGFFNIFLPSNIGGDSYRIYDVMHRSKEGVRSVASVFADRLSGFIALVSLSLLSSVAVAVQLQRPVLILLPLVLLSLLLFLLYLLWKQEPVRMLLRVTGLARIETVGRFMEKFFVTFARYGAEKKVVWQVMAISFLFQFLMVFAVYLMARSLHASVPLVYFYAFVPLITLMEAIPLSVYGIGIRDMGYVFFFGLVGMSDVQTRSLALMFLAVTLVYSLLGGALFVGRVISSWTRTARDGI